MINTNKDYFPIINATIQTVSMGLLSIFNIHWGIYFVMGMLSIVTVLQILAAGAFFSGTTVIEDTYDEEQETKNISTQILLGLLYLVSCYFIYMLGFIFLAGVFTSQVMITLYTNILKAVK